MTSATYVRRRGQLEEYFDRTAVHAWAALTSNTPVSRIRQTVRAGRTEMRNKLLGWLPGDLKGARVLDAGCGTGAMAVELARRGAEVVAVDISATLVRLAEERLPEDVDRSLIHFRVGDMLNPAEESFDYVVAMDSLIHYPLADAVRAVSALGARSGRGVLFTFAPRTTSLAVMHAVGRLFPRGNRAPAIEPVRSNRLHAELMGAPDLTGYALGRSERVTSGFYMSQALELTREATAG